MRIGIIGYGKMGSAIAKSLSSKMMGNAILCVDSNPENIKAAEKLGMRAAASSAEIAQRCDYIFICVKPKDVAQVLGEMKPFVKNQVFVSIAAGKRSAVLESGLGGGKIVRVMPNIAALVGSSVNVFTCRNLSEREKGEVADLLALFGEPVEMEERHFDAVTALSGSGPAFIAYFIESLVEAGKSAALPKDAAYTLALETVEGTLKLLKEGKLSPAEIIEMVSSPNGTTVAGRRVLEGSDVRKVLRETIAAARKRSEELGKDVE